jgi:probable F420-dependent oxidoreductase
MRLGAIIPNDTGPGLALLGLGRMASEAERAGAESIWVSDHLLMVDADTSDYPYSEDGRPNWAVDAEIFEAFTCCSFIAAATERCRVGTAILVLPQRNVFEVAKVAASIDQLSAGRLVLGVGAGWYAAEFEALGYSYADRGARFDEMLEVLRECWSGRPKAFSGQHVVVPPDVVLSPRPAQPEGPPLLIGGMSDRALRRSAELGDGWLALADAEELDLDRLRERLAALGQLQREAEAGDRLKVLKLHALAASASELPSMVADVAALGFDEVMIEPPWDLGIDAACETLAAAAARLADSRAGPGAGDRA